MNSGLDWLTDSGYQEVLSNGHLTTRELGNTKTYLVEPYTYQLLWSVDVALFLTIQWDLSYKEVCAIYKPVIATTPV